MSFRARSAAIGATAVAVTIAVAAAGAYLLVRDALRGQVDSALRERVAEAGIVSAPAGGVTIRLPEVPLGGAGGRGRVVTPQGALRAPPGVPTLRLPVTDRARAVAAGTEEGYFQDATVEGVHVRVLTEQVGPGHAYQLARPLDEVDATLRRLRLLFGLLVLGGFVVAGGVGLLASRTLVAPVARLTAAAERVAATRRLDERIDSSRSDELGRLGVAFNRMLEELDASLAAQRRLVEDASHELRTPLTSLRTNAEVVAELELLPPEERRRLAADVVEQVEELDTLVSDLVELARGTAVEDAPEPLRLDELAAAGAEAMRRHAPGTRFELDLEPVVVSGSRRRLERAIRNLLDNAVKWSPPGGPVEVTVRDGELRVRDHGPGIDRGEAERVFERFYRGAEARGTPGSGLGLAIVRHVAELHGGTVAAEPAAGGGALLRLRLPSAGTPER